MEPQVGTIQAGETQSQTGEIQTGQTQAETGEIRTGQTETDEPRTERTEHGQMAGQTQDKTAQAGTVRVGEIVEGKVSAITSFGAFVALENRRSGLVHISEIANSYVNDVHDFLQEGQTVKALVLSMENGRINLSIKKALPRPAQGESASGKGASRPASGRGQSVPRSSRPAPSRSSSRSGSPREATLPPSGDQAFEDKLKRFLSSSEGKMADLNRSMDGKRGGRRRK